MLPDGEIDWQQRQARARVSPSRQRWAAGYAEVVFPGVD